MDKTPTTETALKAVCVYCGSHEGNNPAFVDAARTLGLLMAREGVALVYGGASIGIMGAAARAVLRHKGEVIGVIPDFLTRVEVTLHDVSELIVTETMHDRKKIMFDRSDAFVALPGGIGTLEEVVEMMTWAQLGQHGKPIVFANIERFWDPLLELLDHMIAAEFVHKSVRSLYDVVDRVEDVLPRIGKMI